MAEQKQCKQCQVKFTVEDEDLAFYKKISPTFAGETFAIPAPTKCPVCRSRNRQAFRNLRNLYKRKGEDGKAFFTHYDKSVPFPVYDASRWWSDDWDAMKFGRDFDKSKSFFEQFKELYSIVPSLGRNVLTVDDCDYANGIANSRHCFLSFNVDKSEDCFYVTDCLNSKSCLDCLAISGCELCYECVRCVNCYDLRYSIRCADCRESMFLSDCKNCSNCIGCANLSNKQYHIFNKEVSKDEYEAKARELQSHDNLRRFEKEYERFQLQFPKKNYYGANCEDCSGDHLTNASGVQKTYFADNCEECKYCYYLFNAKNCMDYEVFGDNSSWIYNCLATGENCSNNSFCLGCWSGSSNNFYCYLIAGCKNCFGCIGLKHKQYCILNRQYTQEEYEVLVPQIIQKMIDGNEWGEFFPMSMSPFAYNETVAHEHYPLSREKIAQLGCHYKEPTDLVPTHLETISSSALPDTIDEAEAEICQKVIKCAQSGRLYQIQKGELAFYQAKKIPLPRLHSEVRHADRSKRRNTYLLHHRRCMCEEGDHGHEGRCSTTFETTYNPDRPERVYCESCYQKSTI